MSDPTGDALRANMIEIPLSQIGSVAGFIEAANKYRDAVERHMMGEADVPAPYADNLVASVVARIPDTGPVASRGPDKIVVMPYRVVDDLPKPPEVEEALAVLRQSVFT